VGYLGQILPVKYSNDRRKQTLVTSRPSAKFKVKGEKSSSIDGSPLDRRRNATSMLMNEIGTDELVLDSGICDVKTPLR
jgi:hypothetical protein